MKNVTYCNPHLWGTEKAAILRSKRFIFEMPHIPPDIYQNLYRVYTQTIKIKYIPVIPIAMREFVGMWGTGTINRYNSEK